VDEQNDGTPPSPPPPPPPPTDASVADQAPHHSLLSKSLGAGQRIMDFISVKNIIKFYTLWTLFSRASSWFSPDAKSPNENAFSPLSTAQQHFKLEPIGFLPSMTTEKENGYFRKDVAMWEAFEKVELVPSSDVRIIAHDFNTSTCAPDSPINITSELANVDSLVQAKKENSTDGIPETAQSVQAGRPTAIVLDLKPGKNVQNDISFIRNAVSFLLGMIRDRRVVNESAQFEVIVVLQSLGGSINAYGLLADQLRRLRTEPGITLTVSCDQSALSGGYLLASLASPGQLLAAPFASIGSIGVVTIEMLNFHDALDKLGIKPIRFQGGQWKAPMSAFGDISDEDVVHMQAHIDSFHAAFREHVQQWRGDVIKDYETATSGAYWLGKKAHELGLVDRLVTSDEYIDEKIRNGDRVLKLTKHKQEEEKGILSFLLSILPSPPEEEQSQSSEFASRTGQSSLLQGLIALQSCVNTIVKFTENS